MSPRIFLFALAAVSSVWGGITVERVAFRTYPFGDPDPVHATGEKRYPYCRYDGSTDTAVTQTWLTVTLDNGRTRVTLLPEIGGKIWRAVTADGKDFLYCNRVMKFRDIAMRGPWLSGGIEFNFGILGHAPSSATPVDWHACTNADGGVSCFVASREYITRTVWQVEVRLPAGAEGFETRVAWYNGSDVPAPYYHWMNAAYPLKGNPEFLFPGEAAVGHEGEIVTRTWPRDAKGRDLSIYRENAFGGPKSYHVTGGDPGFYGIWWPELGYGSGHRAAPYEKYGRKIWLWALSREGAIWEELLTDSDGQYTELQSGRCFIQPRLENYRTPFKHPVFAPGSTETFTENWFPIRDRGAAERACAGKRATMRPIDPPADFDWTSAYGLCTRGEQALRERDDDLAQEKLAAACAKEPNFVPALDARAELAFRRGDYAQVHALCRRALAVDAYDWQANFLDGAASFAEGDCTTARDRLGLAAFQPACRSAALALVARAYLKEGDARAAAEAAEKSLAANPLNRDALLARVIACRADPAARDRAAAAARTGWPIFHAVRYETEGTAFARDVRNELPHETFLELASWYAETGLQEDARALFRLALPDPRASIALARLENRAPAADFKVAGVFPFRRETLPALRWAAARDASWKFKYLLAVQLAFFRQADEADRLLAACGDAPDEAAFYLYRAARRTGKARLADLTRARDLDGSWRAYRALAAHYAEADDWAHAYAVAKTGVAKHPTANPLQIAYAQALVKTGRYRECLDFLAGVKILPSEHRGSATEIWQAAQRALDLPLTWPENLGKGEPYPEE